MSLSVQDYVREYWTSRRNHAMAQARKVWRKAAEADRRSVFEEYFDYGPSAGEVVELWVDEARRCNWELVRSRREHQNGRVLFDSVNP